MHARVPLIDMCVLMCAVVQLGKLHFGIILGWSVVHSAVLWFLVNQVQYLGFACMEAGQMRDCKMGSSKCDLSCRDESTETAEQQSA